MSVKVIKAYGVTGKWHLKSKVVPKGFSAITFGSHVYYKGENPSRRIIKHEHTHIKQYEKHGLFGFWFKYTWQWVKNGFSYKKIELEQEARNSENESSAS